MVRGDISQLMELLPRSPTAPNAPQVFYIDFYHRSQFSRPHVINGRIAPAMTLLTKKKIHRTILGVKSHARPCMTVPKLHNLGRYCKYCKPYRHTPKNVKTKWVRFVGVWYLKNDHFADVWLVIGSTPTCGITVQDSNDVHLWFVCLQFMLKSSHVQRCHHSPVLDHTFLCIPYSKHPT